MDADFILGGSMLHAFPHVNRRPILPPPAGRCDSWGGAAAGPARGDDSSIPFYADHPWLSFHRCMRRRSFHNQLGGKFGDLYLKVPQI